MSQQRLIDCLAFAREARFVMGELSVASLSRVSDKLSESIGSLAYRLEGKLSEKNRAQVFLSVKGELTMCCQRCLESMVFPLDIQNVLEFVDEAKELTQEEIEDDSKDFLPLQKELDVASLIEDEILLVLPFAPCHENCFLPVIGAQNGAVSPFCVLKSLKGNAD